MALLLLDGCEDFSSFTAGGAAAVVAGRYQSGIRLTSTTTTFTYRPPTAAEADTVTVGFAFKWAGPAALCNLMTLFSDAGATSHNTLRIDAAGSLTVTRATTAILTTSVGLVAPNIWHYVELQIRLADAAAPVTLRLNGATVGTFSGDTKNAGTKTVYDTVQWIVSTSQTVDYDDVYVRMAATTAEAFLGNITVETLLPNGNGAVNQWTGIDGDSTDNYLYVDEPNPINLGDYVYSNTVGQQDLYALANLVHTTGTIVGVCHSAYMIRTDSVTPMNVRLINHGASDTKSAALPLSTAYRGYDYVLTVDPETGSPYTIAAVNGLQTGIELA